ncbi:MAG: hypothetical protein ACREJ6_03280, partial [Candidatus Methylomirabilis sp.]
GPGRPPPDPSIRAARCSGQVYKASYDLCLYIEQIVARFSRTHRYALGAELRDGARGLDSFPPCGGSLP